MGLHVVSWKFWHRNTLPEKVIAPHMVSLSGKMALSFWKGHASYAEERKGFLCWPSMRGYLQQNCLTGSKDNKPEPVGQIQPAACYLQMSLYWNIATPILSHVVRGCFHAMMAELSICNRDHNGCKTKIKIQYLVLYRMFADTWLWVFLTMLACLVPSIRLQPA